MLHLFNSLSKTVEPFRPLKGRTVRMYTCGPTVYDFAHVGNLRTYVFEDVLKRVLLLNDYRVRHVMNITDVGHLTGDVDEGEDKVELAAARQRKTATQLAAFYTRAFLKDLSRLNVLPADELPRATEYISEQIAFVRRLERRGYTYVTSDGVYFDTAKFSAYGKAFANSPPPPLTLRGGTDSVPPLSVRGGQEGLPTRSRIGANPEKRNPNDFALWKFSYPTPTPSPSQRGGVGGGVPLSKRQQEWDSHWGVGFPGWHIECSAMGRKLLGQPFDIHCGGVDLIPIHHMNEIAQSEAAYGKPLAAFWLHGAFLTVAGGRMGKSEGNLVTVDELMQRGVDSLAYRYLVLGAHYRSPLNFTWESLAGAQSALEHLREMCRGLPTPPPPPSPREGGKQKRNSPPPMRRGSERGRGKDGQGAFDRLQAAFNDDLDTPKALAILWDRIRDQESGIRNQELSAMVAYADRVFGLGLDRYLGKPLRIPREVQRIAAAREEARQRKDWARSDLLRAQVEALGWRVEDTKDGPAVRAGRKS